MSSNDQYALNWSNHTNHIRKAFDSLLSENEYTDVTLSCEGRKTSAHKILLAACSTYFHDLFRDNPCPHPIIIFKDVKFQNLIDILRFMYNGEVSVATENFDSFLKTAELLQVSGLTEEDNRYNNNSEKEKEPVANESLSAIVEQSQTVISALKTNSETPNEKDVPKKRTFENIGDASFEESPSQKKTKEKELKYDFEIKQEQGDDVVNLEDESLEMKDPLEIGNESLQQTLNITPPDIPSPKIEKSPLTNAERQRRFRERLKQNPEKLEHVKAKKREFYHKTKVLVKDMPKSMHAHMKGQCLVLSYFNST